MSVLPSKQTLIDRVEGLLRGWLGSPVLPQPCPVTYRKPAYARSSSVPTPSVAHLTHVVNGITSPSRLLIYPAVPQVQHADCWGKPMSEPSDVSRSFLLLLLIMSLGACLVRAF